MAFFVGDTFSIFSVPDYTGNLAMIVQAFAPDSANFKLSVSFFVILLSLTLQGKEKLAY